jgi:GDP/UDP-N,N'-diacetylbacillosamine 2-epimerase (hydrolysing)
MKPINVMAVTGIRSEYDILYPVLTELNNKHNLQIAVSGAHLSSNHSNTWERVKDDGFKIADRIDSLLPTDRLVQRAKGTGHLIQGLSQTVERVNPDFIIVIGDREESIASAIVANYHNKLLVHIAGGDPVYGNADDPIRFAVSKLAHIHCCFAEEYKNNLLNIGEEEFRVFWTGNPVYKNYDDVPYIRKEVLIKKLKIINKNYIVLVKHPLSSELGDTYLQMQMTLKALKAFCKKNNYSTVCISPNSDPGSFEILRALDEFKNEDWITYTNTLERKYFINLMRNSSALIGNSSMGILEAPHYKLPVVNIGNRQKGRLNAGNVRFVNYDIDEINNAIYQACLDEEYIGRVKSLKNPFGDGTAAEKIRNVIESVNLQDEKWYIKKKLCP